MLYVDDQSIYFFRDRKGSYLLYSWWLRKLSSGEHAVNQMPNSVTQTQETTCKWRIVSCYLAFMFILFFRTANKK